MATNLTGTTVSATYSQLLHIDDGPAAVEKVVRSGVGVTTALKVGTGSASVDNIRLDGNTISSADTDGDVVIAPNGTGSVGIANANITGGSVVGITDLAIIDGGTGASDVSTARANLGLGTIATQAANGVAITGGSVVGITDLAIIDGGTGASDVSTARANLGLGTIATQAANGVTITGGSISGTTVSALTQLSVDNIQVDGNTISSTDVDGDINLEPNGVGEVVAKGKLGYGTGDGGAVTQLTSRTTGVTLNKLSGQITLFSAQLAGHEADEFVLSNSSIASTDVVLVNMSTSTAVDKKFYTLGITDVSAGACTISVGNNDNAAVPSAGAESPILSFAVLKAINV